VILEVAILDVRPGMEPDFEVAFRRAQRIISIMPGHISHELQHCIEKANRYILLVKWETLESDTVGFRGLKARKASPSGRSQIRSGKLGSAGRVASDSRGRTTRSACSFRQVSFPVRASV
jgi:heme-degrading monooxygenase HmoA